MKKAPLRFSYSKFSTYERCPMAYKFKYIDKVPQRPKSFFSLGSGVHKALELFHSNKKMNARQLVGVFIEWWDATSWSAKGFHSEDEAYISRTQGVDMLQAYYAKYFKVEPRVSYAVERSMDVLVDGLLIKYIVDRIDIRPGDKAWLIDYKTGKSVPNSPEQLYFYQKVASKDRELQAKFKVQGVKLDTLMFLHVNTCKEYPINPAKPKVLKALWDRVLKSAQSIRAQEFPVKRGDQCRWCDYGAACSNGNVCETADKF